MKYVKWLLLLILLASLALGLAACGGDEEPTSPPTVESTKVSDVEPTEPPSSEEPTQAPESVEPTEVPESVEPTEAPEVIEEEEFDASSLSSATDLTSYRSAMRITTMADKDGQEEEQTIEFIIEYTSEPVAQHMMMSGGDAAAASEDETIDMYLVGGTMYMKMGGEWVSMPATEDDIDNDAIITPDSLLSDLCGWKNEGREEIDGVKVRHWSFTKEDYDKCSVLEGFMGLGQLTDAGGDLYVAEDDNYVALMDLFYEGEGLDLGFGQTEEGTTAQRIEIHYEMTDVNEPFTIEAPAEALEASSLPDDIPFPDDAADVTNMFGMITFASAQAPDAVFEFYKAEMPNNGWTENSAEAMPGLWTLEYAKDGRTASIMILEGDAGGSSLMITITEPE